MIGEGGLLDPDLVAAIKEQDLVAVKALAPTVNLNLVPDESLTYLCFASGRASLRIVDFLLSCGADPNVPSRNGRTPLGIAAELGRTANARRLLEAGANVNGAGDGLPLLYALLSTDSNIETFRLLLKHHADPHLAPPGVDPPIVRSRGRFLEALREFGFEPPEA